MEKFATIIGLILGIQVIGGISGAPIAGFMYDNRGTYQGTWLLFAVLMILGMVCIMVLPKVKEASRPADYL